MQAVALFFAFLAVVSAVPPCSYTYTSTTDGSTYSFSYSKMKKSAPNYYMGADPNYSYEMNICDTVSNVDQCSAAGACVCQTNLGTTQYVATIASWTGTPDGTWNIIDATNPAGGAQITFTNGDDCYIWGQWVDRTAIIHLRCGESTSDTFTIAEDSSCTFTIDLTSPYACAGSGGGGGGDSDDLSGGSVFMIIFVVVAFVYIVGGCVFKTVKQGTSGIESCPNIEFWRDLPGLLKDGFRFTFSGCKKGGDSHYDEL
jgi:hypothetical protein